MYGQTLDFPMLALATVAGKSFNGKFTAKCTGKVSPYIIC